MFNYNRLPNPAMAGGMKRYMESGVLPGGFLQAVLVNDLRGAAEAADDINKHLLFEYVSWLYNEAPCGSWGSVDNVAEWSRSKRNGQ